MRCSSLLLRTVAAGLVLCSAGVAQHDRVLGLVRGEHGAPVPGATVRAFALPSSAAPWCDESPAALPAARTDARGRFSLRSEQRVAIQVESQGRGAFLASAAPGVPQVLTLQPLAVVELGDGASGAHVRIDGVPVGFVAGQQLALPAADLELLVEHPEGAFVAACRPDGGARVRIAKPAAAPPRLCGVPAEARVVLLPWPERRFAPAADGVVRLPAGERPLRVRVETTIAADLRVDELWVEPGSLTAFAADAAPWGAVVVCDAEGDPVPGAAVHTLRRGPGEPTWRGTSVADARGFARYRRSSDDTCIAIVAAGRALAVVPTRVLPDAGVVRLEPAHELRLRVVDEHAVPLSDAEVAFEVAKGLVLRVRTDGRGGAVIGQLGQGPVSLAVDHAEHVPTQLAVDVPAAGPVEVALEPGLVLRGRVLCADGKASDDVLLEVREGAFRRRVPVAADGRFTVCGLPRAAVDLFAWRVERGVTWSGQARDVVPGASEVTLAIACDDPAPGQR